MRMAVHNHFIDPGRMEQEGTLYANTIAGNTPHGKVRVVPAAMMANNRAFKFLGALCVAFLDTNEDAHHIPRIKGWNIGVLGDFNISQNFTHNFKPHISANNARTASPGDAVVHYNMPTKIWEDSILGFLMT